MTRITPRTCLWPITFTLCATFALSIGLTYRSNHHCFAGTCGEWLFPLQARLHVVVWYLWVSLSVAFLAVRAFHPRIRAVLQKHMAEKKIPILGKHLNVSGLLLCGWVLLLYGAAIGIWWVRLRDYFSRRGTDGGVTEGNYKLAAIALTGHLTDISTGMVLLPISRHSALASFFKLSASTTLAFHMVLAYILFILVAVHAVLYAAWLPTWSSFPAVLRQVYPVLNPTYLHHEAWPGNTSSLGLWRASLPFTGLFTTMIMLLVFVTTLPHVRRRFFNLFYFTHLAVIAAIIVICLHASTMFYCTSPGLVLWLVDWMFRAYELWSPVDGRVTSLGKGYYMLDMPMPRNRLDGCACTSPLAHFYIYHSDSSIRELHPFTTITHLASANAQTPSEELDLNIQFIFRKRSNALVTAAAPVGTKKGFVAVAKAFLSPKRKKTVQWTEKLASRADNAGPTGPTSDKDKSLEDDLEVSRSPSIAGLDADHPYPIIHVGLRIEGPYFTPADPSRYHTVVCLVAGTGISGGIAVAKAFLEMQRQRASSESLQCISPDAKCVARAADSNWQRCVVVWSVREEEAIELPFLQAELATGLELRYQLTGRGRPRIDFAQTVSSILDGPDPKDSSNTVEASACWVYLSGPNTFITTGEAACKSVGVDYYGARWEI